MGLNIEFTVILAYAFGLILLYIIGWVLIIPLRVILKLIGNAIIGGLLLIVINFLGKFIGITIGINPITALVVGLLGIPGIALLLVIQYLL